jgi:phosphopantothenoylcysteine decarboxylase/phosphopantothenate--cysteine ligase
VRIVVTAGPTREPIDPVRFLSNRSSGKMGFAIADEFARAGHDVTLIAGPVAAATPEGVQRVDVETAEEMYREVNRAVAPCDVLVMCAAVADYKPRVAAATKIKKGDATMTLELVATRDILKSLPNERSFYVVGFAAETNDVERNGLTKLRAKNCDMLVANDVSARDVGMEADENAVVIFTRDGQRDAISRAPKKIIARELVEKILRAREKSFDNKNAMPHDSSK